jgi:hypothetical protein
LGADGSLFSTGLAETDTADIAQRVKTELSSS